MKKIQDICYAFVFFAYFASWSLALSDGAGFLTLSPLLAYTCAVFGITGGCVLFSACFKKFRQARRKGLQVNWYNSPSVFIGCALFVLGLLPVSSSLRFLPFSPKPEPVAQLIIGTGIFFLLFAFLLLALIYRHKEE